MPTNYRRPQRVTRLDWVPLAGVIGALAILGATTVGYLSNLETKEEANIRFYLKSGIAPPR
jgi:hypothetical protein